MVTAEALYSHRLALEIAERKVLRLITRAPFGCSNKDLYAEAGIQPIGERLKILRQQAVICFGEREGIKQLEDARAFIAPAPFPLQQS